MFYGLYASSLGECKKEFVTTPADAVGFPPAVRYECDYCNTTHNFYYVKAFTVVGKSQQQRFGDYVTSRHMDTDVDLE